MKTNAIWLALLFFCMSLAGCVSQSDGVVEAEPADRPSVSIVLIEVEIWNMESTSGTSGWTHGFLSLIHI